MTTMNKPASGDTNWYQPVTDNWTVLDNALIIDPAYIVWDNTNKRLGIGTVSPDVPRRRLDVLDASNPQFRITHTDNSVYTDFQTDASGNLIISPSGGNVGVAGSASFAQTIISTVSSGVAVLQDISGGTNPLVIRLKNTNTDAYWGLEGSVAGGFFTGSSAYDTVLYTNSRFNFIISGNPLLTITAGGAATITGY